MLAGPAAQSLVIRSGGEVASQRPDRRRTDRLQPFRKPAASAVCLPHSYIRQSFRGVEQYSQFAFYL